MTITYGNLAKAGTITASLPTTKRTEGRANAASVQIQLAANTVMSLTPSRQGSIRITGTSGTLWITQQGDSRDHILSAADTFTTKTTGKVVVQAIGTEATLRLSEV